MAFEILQQNHIFDPGDSLWIIAPKSRSHWSAKLDWYMNFQIDRGLHHQMPTVPEEIQQTLREEEMDLPMPEISNGLDRPLLLSTSHFFPNRMTLVVPFSTDLKTWTEQCKLLASQLRAPSVRVFAPDAIPAEQVGKSWGSGGPSLSVVPSLHESDENP